MLAKEERGKLVDLSPHCLHPFIHAFKLGWLDLGNQSVFFNTFFQLKSFNV